MWYLQIEMTKSNLIVINAWIKIYRSWDKELQKYQLLSDGGL